MLLPATPHNTQMRKLSESLLQTTEQLKAPQRISLTLLNRAQQIVRHQMIWDYFSFYLEEDWPHLIVDDYAAAFR